MVARHTFLKLIISVTAAYLCMLPSIGLTFVTTAISPTIGAGDLGTTVPPTLPSANLCTANCVITGGTRVGANLFHSFGQFSIGTSDIATFQNTQINGAFPLTSNILSRVTDGQPSQIFGTLRTADFGNANLFLMNPAGIIFGPNATLNVGGSVTFTTANNIKLTDGQLFNATPDPVADPPLSAAPIASFGFLGPTVLPIAVYGLNVQGPMPTDDAGVPLGQKVALIGGDIKFTSDPESGAPSTVIAPGRQIQITSVAGAGNIAADTLLPITPHMDLGTITLDPGTVISTAGDPTFGDASGGSISIRGGQFVATGATIMTSPFTGSADMPSTGSGGAFTVNVTGTAELTDSVIQTGSFMAGGAGPMSISADEGMTVTNSVLDATAFSSTTQGNGGAVILATNGPLSMTDSFILTVASDSGSAGSVTATAKNLIMERSGIATFVDVSRLDVTSTPTLGMVSPGTVDLTGEDSVNISHISMTEQIINTTAIGTLLNAGAITITGNTVNLSNGTIAATMFNAPTVVSPGKGGTIEIRANEVNLSQFSLSSLASGLPESTGTGGTVRLMGHNNARAENIQLTASEINVNATTGGGAGAIEFQTKSLTLSTNTDVSANSFSPGPAGTVTVRQADNVTIGTGSRVLTDAVITLGGIPQRPAGSILFETQQLTISGGGLLRSSALPLSTGNAGSVTVQGKAGAGSFSGSILIDGAGSGIFTNTQGTGAGGNITLTANEVTIQNGGTVSASTSGNAVTAMGGDITIVASRSVELNSGGSISASSTGPADAGNITINAGSRFESRNSSVTTKSEHAGGGNVAINATDQFRLVNSQVNASAFLNGGNIRIDPNLVILQNSQILARAIQGNGGDITIFTPVFLADSSSLVSASSRFGLNGTVTIQSPTSNLSGSVGTLTSNTSQAQSLLTQRCAALANGQASSFVVAGREQLPADPGGWLSSPIAFAGIDVERFGNEPVAEGTSNLEPQISGLLANDTVSLRRLTPAGFLIANFADSEATGCHS